MLDVTFLFIIGVIVTVVAVVLSGKKEVGSILPWILTAFALVVFGTAIFSPNGFGYGRIPYSAEEFTARLKEGTAYQVISSTEDGGDQVLLVKGVVKKQFLAIRVKAPAPPSEYFALVDGQPVAIGKPVAVAAPAEALSAKK
ncbi:MAG: hypothetical protein UY97_C0014G0004 [Parcubacteria group bacterium GW2011_GWB1_57_6]|nr:MAG: hypothetical protein UY93_C0003G0044 [Parcubacteria group bacterium GW2011_GWA1_56_13]KKW45806.1 MAG: hypothetical protein UY97_C0014G0004 [Parcubacteria group bacterium GW2011_GWB1_57_6]